MLSLTTTYGVRNDALADYYLWSTDLCSRPLLLMESGIMLSLTTTPEDGTYAIADYHL